MMRRVVDTCIPASFVMALVPPVFGWAHIPDSAFRFLGNPLGRIWAASVVLSFGIVITGIWLRKSHPATALWVETPALGVSAILASVYIAALCFVAGGSAWPGICFMSGLCR